MSREEKIEECISYIWRGNMNPFSGSEYTMFRMGADEYGPALLALHGVYRAASGKKRYNWFMCSWGGNTDLLSIAKDLREELKMFKKCYPAFSMDVHVLSKDETIHLEYIEHNYYKDVENDGYWDWIYKTSECYSYEDGWWYEEPVYVRSKITNNDPHF